jgi:predicted nucleotidyltransferase
MKPSVAMHLNRDAVREAAGRFRAANPRIFGSVLHRNDQDGSDLDLLADALPGARPCSTSAVCKSSRKICLGCGSIC